MDSLRCRGCNCPLPGVVDASAVRALSQVSLRFFPPRTNSAFLRTPTAHMDLHQQHLDVDRQDPGILGGIATQAIVGALVARFLGFGFRMDRHPPGTASSILRRRQSM